MQTLHKAAQAVARKGPLDITNMAQFRDACLSAARMFGWEGQPSVTYYGNDNRSLVVCDETRRRELIEQRQRLLEAESNGKVIEIEGAAPVTVPAPETRSDAKLDTGNGTVTQEQSPVVQPDPVFQHMQSIGNAESWGEPVHNGAMFGPHPDELE